MPITIKSIFESVNIQNVSQIKWNSFFDNKEEGVYIVSLSSTFDKNLNSLEKIKFNEEVLKKWINKLPDFTIDGERVTIFSLKKRLSEFWLADENILYIGKAPKRKNGDGISNRIIEYYNTEIGDSGPHSGGQWIKVLENIENFYIYYAICENPTFIEKQLLNYFKNNISEKSKEMLFDKELTLPFANINFGGNKKHGMKNQRK